jgi:hypothetical protein
MSNESHGPMMKIDPNAPIGISLPLVRASGFGIDSFYPYGTATAALPRTPSLDAGKQRGGLFGRMKGRQGNVNSVASWGNKGPLTQSTVGTDEPNPVPVRGAMSDISGYLGTDFVPPPPLPAAMTMSRGGSGRGRQRVQVEGYYPRSNSGGSGAQSGGSRSKSRDGRHAGDHPPAQTHGSTTSGSAYSSTESVHPFNSSSVVAPLLPPAAGRAPLQNYHPAPVEPPSRAKPLVQRRLSAYEGDDGDYYYYDNDGAGGTRTGVSKSRPAPEEQYGIAL